MIAFVLRAVEYLVLIGLWVASFGIPQPAGRRRRDLPQSAPPPQSAAPRWALALAAPALAAATLLQLGVIARAAAEQVPLPAWRAALPLVPVDDSAPLFGHTAAWITNSSGSLALLQAVLLAVLYALLRRRPPGRSGWLAIALAGALMAGGALFTSGLTSTDVYLYAGHGRLGLGAYAPPATRFPGEFGAINDLRGVPIYPLLYGPVWLAVEGSVNFFVHGLAAALFAYRLIGLALFGACVALVARELRSPALVALFALNPAFYEQYVADAHNDVLPLALTLAAIALMKRNEWLGLFLVAAAGATKLPFAFAGLVAFDAVTSRTKRIWMGAVAACAALAATYAASGGAYFSTSARMSARIARDPFVIATHDVAIVLALTTAALALVFRRYLAGGAWSFLALSTWFFPWYVAWSVPYALIEETMLPAFLCTLPVVTFLLSSIYSTTGLTLLMYAGAIVSPLLLLVLGRHRAEAVA